jgi:hypothetical protein
VGCYHLRHVEERGAEGRLQHAESHGRQMVALDVCATSGSSFSTHRNTLCAPCLFGTTSVLACSSDEAVFRHAGEDAPERDMGKGLRVTELVREPEGDVRAGDRSEVMEGASRYNHTPYWSHISYRRL